MSLRTNRNTVMAQPAPTKLDIQVKDTVIKPEDYKLVTKDTKDYYDQMRRMIIAEGWTTQDHATLSLLQEMPNCHCFFIVRKSDDLLLGALTMIVTDHIVYGNTQVMRRGFRAAGLGSKMIKAFLITLREDLQKKALVGRAVRPMWRAYTNKPFNAKFFYEMYSLRFADRADLRSFFPLPSSHNYHVVSIKDTAQFKWWMMESIIEFDKMVTGQDRTTFLKNYFSIDFVDAVVLFDQEWKPQGLAAICPTGNIEGQVKLNPIYCRTPGDAAILVHAIADVARHPNTSFVTHIRRKSAGEWILKRAMDSNRHLHLVGATICATHIPVLYKDLSKPELIFAPTNSPAHFDG